MNRGTEGKTPMEAGDVVAVQVNGAEFSFPAGAVVADMLAKIPHPPVFAVEVDGAIVPPSKFGGTVLRDGSVVEIVGFVGGG